VRLSAARAVEFYVDDRRLKISIGLEEWLSNLNRLGKVLADLRRRGEMAEIREIRAQGANVWVGKSAASQS
jgi:cell division protein FtsQ